MKTVKAVAPYIYEGGINFKHKPYEAWMKLGGDIAPAHYPPRWLHGLAFRYELPMLVKGQRSKVKGEARLRFVEPVSLYFDTFPDYCLYEIIPFFWDVWPQYFDKVFAWLRKHQVRTAIFTSSQTADMMREIFPRMNVLWCPEAVDAEKYGEGKDLKKRIIELYEIGSVQRGYFRKKYPEEYEKLHKIPEDWDLRTDKGYKSCLENSRVTVVFPKNITEPEIAQGIETLTQRYWECMLSRMVMIGHSPKELTDLIGYNPVIELDMEHDLEQIKNILADIENPIYQQLVNRNRETALQLGSWEIRMKRVMEWLSDLGYKVK